MTKDELLEYVYMQTGTKRNIMSAPIIIAISELCLVDLANILLQTNSELSKKLITSVANQVWASSSFSAPTDMLFTKQKNTIRLDLGGTLAFQVEDRAKLDLSPTGMSNHYYALEGKTFYIKHSAGTTGESNLNLRYYKVPALTDIDSELKSMFLNLVLQRVVPQVNNGKSK